MITIANQKMKKIELIRELEKHVVFNLKTVREITGKGSSYAKLLVYRIKKDNLITEIERNKYTMKKDPLLIASNIIWPSYISFWSALRYHNLTEQLPQDVMVITTRTRKKRKIDFNNIKIIFIKIKPKYLFGYRKERYHGAYIFMAEPEKALIDSALFKKISFSEIYSVMKNNLSTINIELLLAYLIKIRNKALIKRFGFLLDNLGTGAHKKLKKFIDFKYIPLDYSLPAKGKKDKKWKVIKNAQL